MAGTLGIEATGADGSTVELPDVEAPSYVGELGLLHSRPRSASVTTKQDSTLLRIDGKEFLNALEAAPPSVSLKTLAGVRLARTPGADALESTVSESTVSESTVSESTVSESTDVQE